MRKKVSAATLLLMLVSLFAVTGHASAALTTGVCTETPNAFDFCEKYYVEGELFNGLLLSTTAVFTDGTNTLECKKSETGRTIGPNPVIGGPVSIRITSLNWNECKSGTGVTCGLESPAPGDAGFPWATPLQWSAAGTTGPNGTVTTNNFSVRAECGFTKCNYIGVEEPENSIKGKFFNANDTNKPVASTRAEIQFKNAKLNASGSCSGQIEFSAVYSIYPKVENARNVFLSNG